MAPRLIIECMCGMPNDLTTEADAVAANASGKQLVTVKGKCKKCGRALSREFDPFVTAQKKKQ